MFKFRRAISLGKVNEDCLLLSFKLIQHVQLVLTTTAYKSGKNAWHASLNASSFKNTSGSPFLLNGLNSWVTKAFRENPLTSTQQFSGKSWLEAEDGKSSFAHHHSKKSVRPSDMASDNMKWHSWPSQHTRDVWLTDTTAC